MHKCLEFAMRAGGRSLARMFTRHRKWTPGCVESSSRSGWYRGFSVRPDGSNVFAEQETLRNNLKGGVGSLERIDGVLSELGIDPRLRGERLTVNQLRSLTKALILN